MADKSFDNLSDALNVDFVRDKNVKVEDKIKKFEVVKDAAKEALTSPEYSLEDKEYMQMELKMLTQGGLTILDRLEQDISVGTKVRSHEVYFTGMNSIMGALKELRELGKVEVDIKMAKEKQSRQGGIVGGMAVNQEYDSSSLLLMLKDAQKNNSLNDVEAKFRIEDTTGVNFRKKTEKKEVVDMSGVETMTNGDKTNEV